MPKLTPNGLAAVQAVLILAIVAIISGTGYYVYQANKSSTVTYNTAQKAAQANAKKAGSQKVVTKQYKSSNSGATFNYSSDWHARSATNIAKVQKDSITLVNQSGKLEVSWDNNVIGIGSPTCSTDIDPGVKDASGQIPGCPLWKNTSIVPLDSDPSYKVVSGYITTDGKDFTPYIAIQDDNGPLMTSNRGGVFMYYQHKDFRSWFSAGPTESAPKFKSAEAAANYLQNDPDMQVARKIIASLAYQ